MPATPVSAAASGQLDGNGNGSFVVRGFTPGTIGAWSAIVSTTKGVCTVLAGGVAITPPTPVVFGGLGIGPIYQVAGPPITITITGGLADDLVVITTNGMESPNGDDVAGVGGMAASVYGSSQDNPANLLVGQVGPPLVENLSVTVPGSGSHLLFVGSFDVSGYGALLLYGDPPPSSSALWLWIGWEDSTGNPIGYSQIDALNPKFCAMVGCEAAACEIFLANFDSSAHNMNGLTIIPLAQMPVHPELLIPTAGGAFPVSATPTTPPNLAIISGVFSTPVGQTIIAANFVWPGRAIWSVGSNAGSAVVAWDASLVCIDAAGIQTPIARMGSGVANPPPVVVQLTSGVPQVTWNNSGGATTSTKVSLIATS